TAGGYPFVWATMLGGDGLLADVQLSGSALYASPGFPGAVGDQVLVSGAATTVLNPSGVQLNAKSSFQQENPHRTGSMAAQTINAELSTKIPVRDRGAEISVGWRLRSRQDMIPDPDFSQLLNTVTAVTRIHMGDVYLGLDAGLGLDREVLADAWALSQRYNLALRWVATPQTTYNSHLAFSSRRSTNYPLDRSFSLGFVANQNWGPIDTSARTGLALASRDGEFDSLSSFVAAHADIPVWGDHTISLHGHIQYEFDSGGSGFTGGVSLGYSAPVNIPTTRKRGVGTVEGLAYMTETGLPADSVVIRVADRAVVTGSEGVFRLSTLQPGEYFLEVDTSRVGRGIIPDLPTPIKIPIRADETTHIDLPIVRGATISGAVALYAAPGERQGLLNTLLGDDESEYEEDDLSLVGGLANAVVHISRDDEIRRVLTDRSGNFSLTDIRPGRWNVRIGNAQLPRYHRLVQDEFEVIIEPGDEVTITFQVFPIRRPVTMLSVSDIPITIAATPDEPTPVPLEEPEPEPERTPPVLDSGAQDL
ncbi:MAG: carboxypeptidase regulatory-like domain-containing protein, partial [Spirochaetaceae bacterium]|nr:carboxypeptidase regulatory-like domain-containing protein [Spirochaetaceae bacterium]